MRTKFKGTVDKNTRLGDLVLKIKRQVSNPKGIEIVLDGQIKIIREVYIIK